MNDLILITVSAIGGGIVGFLGCAIVTSGKLADYSRAIFEAEGNRDHWLAQYDRVRKEIAKHVDAGSYQSRLRLEAEAAHSRCADALAAKNDRIDRALACVTENSAHVGKKMAAILKGDR